MKRRVHDLLGEGGTVVGKGAVVLVHEIGRCCVGLCQIRGGNTENNNRVKLHKYQIWASAGRIIDKPACRQRQRGARSHRKRELIITERTQKKTGEGVSLIRTTLSLCSPIPSARPHSRYRPPPPFLHISQKHTVSCSYTLARGLPCETLA